MLLNKHPLGLLARSLVFCIGLAVMLTAADFVLTPSAGTLDGWAASRAVPGEVDVIALGSSRTYCTVLPMEMWRTQGITALDVTSAIQIVPVTAAYLDQVLLEQEPHVVMVETYMVGRRSTFDTTTAHKSLDYMPAGPAKAESILRWVAPSRWSEFFMPLHIYHSRWSQMARQDLRIDKYVRYAYGRGAMYLPEETSLTVEPQPDPMLETAYLEDLPYIRRMAEQCRAHGALLVLFSAPSPYRMAVGDVPLLDRLERDMSDMPNVRFLDLNMVTQEVGVDPRTDYKDDLHLNHRGAVKISRWLAENLRSTYDLEDHRNDPIAQRWNRDLAEYDDVFTEW